MIQIESARAGSFVGLARIAGYNRVEKTHPKMKKMKTQKLTAIILLTCLGLTSVNYAQAQSQVHVVQADQGMVVCNSPLASRVGRDMLARGGNAVDAAVATAFVMAVTWPEAGNIGGGGFMLVQPAEGEPTFIDYREKAPLTAGKDTYDVNDTTYSRKAVGVPGTVRGLELAHQQFGKLPWKDLVLPAAEIAKNGFNVDQHLADSTNSILKATKGKSLYEELHRVYGKPDGTMWKAGDIMVLPDLSKTLEAIANGGADAFYQGPIADLLVDEMKRGDGMISSEDLLRYQAKIRKPIIGSFNGYKVIGAPPPSSGGTCLVMGLNMVEALDLPKDKRYSAETLHLIGEVSRRAFLERARHLGDPDFNDIPEKLTTKEFASELIKSIDPEKASISTDLAPEIPVAEESPSTTHFSVLDADGMAVSNTYTLEASWGSRMVVPGAGYVLNNEMGDFNWVEGLTNRRGRIGTKPNLVQPEKRMLSSMCPAIVTKDDKVVLVTGSPGGRTIINTVFGIVLNLTHFDMNGLEAVQAPRFHHQWLPDRIQLEVSERYPEQTEAIAGLEKMGHRVSQRSLQGSAHSIWIDQSNGKVFGISDPRRGGRAAGVIAGNYAVFEFAEPARTPIHMSNLSGRIVGSWTSTQGMTMDGFDHLDFRSTHKERQTASFFEFKPKQNEAKFALSIKLAELSFTDQGEFEIGFSKRSATGSSSLANVSISGSRDGIQATLKNSNAERLEGSPNAVSLSNSHRIDDHLTLTLELDYESKKTRLLCRRNSMTRPELLQELDWNEQAKPTAVELSTHSQLDNDIVKIDRIEIKSN